MSVFQNQLSNFNLGNKREFLIKKATERLSINTLRQMIKLAQDADSSAKGLYPEPAWQIVRDIIFLIAGSNLRK